MSIVKGLFSLLVIILIALAVLFVDFAYKTFSLRQQDVKTGAIVVLTGGRGRIEEGVRLYREQKARWLFLIGVDPSVQKKDLFKGGDGEMKGEGIILEKVSRNTLENAFYSRDLIIKNDIHSIRLIPTRWTVKISRKSGGMTAEVFAFSLPSSTNTAFSGFSFSSVPVSCGLLCNKNRPGTWDLRLKTSDQ
jgi:uncharacterized SAM-binding protein YcdF (DUF218 family)